MSEGNGIRDRKLSDKVTARIGYPDGHMEIGVRVPIVGTVWLTLEAPDDLFKAAEVINEALDHIKGLSTVGRKRR